MFAWRVKDRQPEIDMQRGGGGGVRYERVRSRHRENGETEGRRKGREEQEDEIDGRLSHRERAEEQDGLPKC